MLSIEEAKVTLKNIGMSDEDSVKFEKIVEPFIEYHKYLMLKEDISSEDAENRTQIATKTYLSQNITGVETQVELFKIVGKGYKEYALETEYDEEKCELLETNLVQLVNMFVEITSKLNESDEKNEGNK